MRTSCRFAVAAALALAGCAQSRLRSEADAATRATAQQTRQAAQSRLGDAPSFHVRGRIAISQRSATDSDGGNGSFDWQQSASSLQFSLSAPLSNQTWTLSGETDGPQSNQGRFTLTDSRGKVQRGSSAEALIADAGGWDIPVSELKYWLHALPAPGESAQTEFDARGLPVSFVQFGWNVKFERYVDARCIQSGVLCQPLKLSAFRVDPIAKRQTTVKVIISRWLSAEKS